MKRGRHIMNKVELTRLQKHYEYCMEEINTLEYSKNSVPTIASISCGLAGYMAYGTSGNPGLCAVGIGIFNLQGGEKAQNKKSRAADRGKI